MQAVWSEMLPSTSADAATPRRPSRGWDRCRSESAAPCARLRRLAGTRRVDSAHGARTLSKDSGPTPAHGVPCRPPLARARRRRRVAGGLDQLDQLTVGNDDEAGGRLEGREVQYRLVEHALARGTQRTHHPLQIRDAEREMRQPWL